MNSPGPPVRGAVNLSEWLERTLQLFRVTLLKCLPLATVAMLFPYVPNLWWIATGHDLLHGLPKDSTYWVMALVAAAFALFFASAVMLQQRSIALGVPFSAATSLAAAARRLPVLLLSWILAQLSLSVGFSLLFLPQVVEHGSWALNLGLGAAAAAGVAWVAFLLVCYLVLLPVVLFERHNPYDTLVRCVRLVRAHWWKIFLALLIALIAVLAGLLVMAAALAIVASVVAGQGPAFQAIVAAGSVAIDAIALALLLALSLTLHSALASSSA